MYLLKEGEKLGRCSLYVCHTNAITAHVEYGTRCLH